MALSITTREVLNRYLFYPNSINRRHRQLDAALAWVRYAEIIPLIALAFLLLGMPLLLAPVTFADGVSWLWWVKAWAPVWAVACFFLYGALGAAVAPVQVTGAAVAAMEQSGPDEPPVPMQGRVEQRLPLSAPIAETVERDAAVKARAAWREILIRPVHPSPLPYPFRRLCPRTPSPKSSN